MDVQTLQYKHCCHVDDCVYTLHEWGLGYFISTFWSITFWIRLILPKQIELQTIHSFVLSPPPLTTELYLWCSRPPSRLPVTISILTSGLFCNHGRWMKTPQPLNPGGSRIRMWFIVSRGGGSARADLGHTGTESVASTRIFSLTSLWSMWRSPPASFGSSRQMAAASLLSLLTRLHLR